MKLAGYQKRHLRGLAHDLSPVAHVGKAGLTEAVVRVVEEGLGHHELIKVRLAGDKAEKKAMVASLEERLGCSGVGLIGNVATLYREHPDEEKRRLELPRRASRG